MIQADRRRRRVLDLLARDGYGSISVLATVLEVSPMTVRRDLDHLESQGLIRRTHGGAVTESLGQVEIGYAARTVQNARAKRLIAKAAAALVHDGDVIFVDAGTTTLALAEFLAPRKSLTVVTHSLAVVQKLTGREGVEVFLLGGQVRADLMSVVGYRAEESLATFRIDTAFLGTGGVDLKRGLTHSTPEEIPIKKLAARIADRVVVLADHSKIGKKGASFFLPPSEIDLLITDANGRAVIRRFDQSARRGQPEAKHIRRASRRRGSVI